MQVMLISILINIHYLQNIVSSFQEDSNGQNHYLSDSHHPRFLTLLLGGIFSLKKHWRWEYIHTSKTSVGGNIFLRKDIISKSVMENITTSKRKASSQCPLTLSAGGGEEGRAEKFVMLAKMKEDLHFLNF